MAQKLIDVEEERRRLEAIRDSETVVEAAEKLGMPSSSLAGWMQRRRLKIDNVKVGPRSKHSYKEGEFLCNVIETTLNTLHDEAGDGYTRSLIMRAMEDINSLRKHLERRYQ